MSKASDELLKLLRAAHDDKTKTKNKEPGYRSRVNDCEELLDELIEREGCPLLNTPQIRRDVIDAVYETLGYASDGRLVRLDDSMNAKEVLLEYITPREYLHVPKAPPDIVGRATVGDENGVVTLAARAALLKDCGGDNPAGLAAYRQILAAHGCSENNLKPGKAPEIKTDATGNKFIDAMPPAAKAKLTNPYSWPLDTPEQRQKFLSKVEELTRVFGTVKLCALARSCGKSISGAPLQQVLNAK